MVEVKSTKGIEQNMCSEIKNLVRKAYTEGRQDGMKEHKAVSDCSWAKGVEDAWECIIDMLKMLGKDGDIASDDRTVMRAIARTLENTNAIDRTRSYVGIKNLKPYVEEDKPIEVGDVVLDPSGNECVITNDDTHYHVIYTSNGKTHKWNKDTKFKPIGKRVVGVGRIRL